MSWLKQNKGILVSVALLSAQWWFIQSPFAAPIQAFFLDTLFTIRGERQPPAEVIIVAIDEPSFAQIGRQWPWPRDLHAQLISALKDAGARTVVMDILFSEPSEAARDLQLANAIAEMGNVVLTGDRQTLNDANFEQTITVLPYSSFMEATAAIGMATLPVDGDGRVRRAQLAVDDIPLLAYAGATAYAPNACCNLSGLNSGHPLLINFYGGPRRIKTVSYYQALDPQRYLPKDIFKEKIVFVGLSLQNTVATSAPRPDYYPTTNTLYSGEYLSGVEIQATVTANLINNTYLYRTNEISVQFAGLLLALILIFINKSTKDNLIFLFVIFINCLIVIWIILFVRYNIHVEIFTLGIAPTLIFAQHFIRKHYSTLEEKKHIRALFSLYLAPDIVKKLESNPSHFNENGEERDASIMFIDIAGYTTLSEKTPPSELLETINYALGNISNMIINNNGLIDKYIGDAVMAVWGAPVEQKEHARHACIAAIELEQLICTLNESKRFPADLDFRIGINSGLVVAGSVGGEKHRNYTVLGDNVNLSSRLEGVNKIYGTRIIISQNTADQLNKAEFVTRELDRVIVVGKTSSVTIYELVGRFGSVDAIKCAAIENYHRALGHYRQQEWDAALSLLEGHAETDPPSKHLLDRCHEQKHTDRSGEWSQVVTLRSK